MYTAPFIQKYMIHDRDIPFPRILLKARWKWLESVLLALGILKREYEEPKVNAYRVLQIDKAELMECLHECMLKNDITFRHRPDMLLVSWDVYRRLRDEWDERNLHLAMTSMDTGMTFQGARVVFSPLLQQDILPVWLEEK